MTMNWTALAYLLVAYWPYLAGAALIGLMVGWRSFTPPNT
jgi:hypothetical protein